MTIDKVNFLKTSILFCLTVFCSQAFSKVFTFNCADQNPPFSIYWIQEEDKSLTRYIVNSDGESTKVRSKSISKINDKQYKVSYISQLEQSEIVEFGKDNVTINYFNLEGNVIIKDSKFVKNGKGPVVLEQCEKNTVAYSFVMNSVKNYSIPNNNSNPSISDNKLASIAKEVQRNGDLFDTAGKKNDFSTQCSAGTAILNLVEKNKELVGLEYYNNVVNTMKSRTHDACVLADPNTPNILDSIKKNCVVYEQAKNRCATANDFNKCVDIVAPGVRNMPIDMCSLYK